MQSNRDNHVFSTHQRNRCLRDAINSKKEDDWFPMKLFSLSICFNNVVSHNAIKPEKFVKI